MKLAAVKSKYPIVALLTAASLTSGCATYSTRVQNIYTLMEQQQPAKALAELDKAPGPERDRLAYLLNRAMLLRITKDYSASNQALEEAKLLIDEFEAVSLSEQAGSLAVNETMSSYEGMPHEHVLVHLYAALNYLELGQLDNARVEALQVNLRLQSIAEKNNGDDASTYNEDPFARYLTGLIYEALGEWSDAMIAYRSAYEAYTRYAVTLEQPPPEFLKEDLVRLSDKVGLKDEKKKYQKEFGIKEYTTVAQLKKMGEVIIIIHNGLAPQKLENVVRVVPENGRMVSIALPYYTTNFRHASNATAAINGDQYSFETVANIDAIAKQTLANQMPALTARAIARAVVKDSVARETQDRAGALAGFVVNIASSLAEVADTRSWWNLPHNIQMVRIPMEPGNYDINVELMGSDEEKLANFTFNNTEINQGKKTFLELHWIKHRPAKSEGDSHG